MNYITKNITTPEGVEKIQVYKIVGAENIDGNTIDTKVFDGEYTKEELLLKINNAKQNVISSGDFVTDLEAKLGVVPTQAEIDLVLAEKQKEAELEAIKKQKSEAIQTKATLTDQLNLLGAVCYKLTEGSTDPEILKARKTYEDIQLILNS